MLQFITFVKTKQMNLIDKERAAIEFIKEIPIENTQFAFSGGKDSIALYYLVSMAGIDVPKIYRNTTIDPPGTMSMIKKYYSDVEISQPEKSFYKLVEEKGLPSRRARFCCEHLKEVINIGKNSIEGIRSDESKRRSLYEPEQCDTRKSMKGAKHYYPIINYTLSDIWETINRNNLVTTPYYHAPYNWKRHGCVGCPLAYKKHQVAEFKTFPKYAVAMVMAIRKNINAGNSISKNFTDEYEAFLWWISQQPLKVWIQNRSKLFHVSSKEIFYDAFVNNVKTQV